MTVTHTELPWAVGDSGRSIIKEVPGLADGHDHYMIAVASSHSLLLPSETKANADLIVRSVNALPELVKALEDIVSHMESKGMGNWPTAKKARATLAKVRMP